MLPLEVLPAGAAGVIDQDTPVLEALATVAVSACDWPGNRLTGPAGLILTAGSKAMVKLVVAEKLEAAPWLSSKVARTETMPALAFDGIVYCLVPGFHVPMLGVNSYV